MKENITKGIRKAGIESWFKSVFSVYANNNLTLNVKTQNDCDI